MNSIINTSAIQKHYTPIALGLTEMYGFKWGNYKRKFGARIFEF